MKNIFQSKNLFWNLTALLIFIAVFFFLVIPVSRVLLGSFQIEDGDGLDGLDCNAFVMAVLDQSVEVGSVYRVLHHRKVIGQEDRVEIETFEALHVHLRRPGAVAGDADEPDQALVTGLDRRPQRPLIAKCLFPLGLVHQVVELDQVDPVRAQAFERTADTIPRALITALVGFGREEHVIAVVFQEGSEPKLGIAVYGGSIDVVNSGPDHPLHNPVGHGLLDLEKGHRPENDTRAFMAGPPKHGFWNHAPTILHIELGINIRTSCFDIKILSIYHFFNYMLCHIPEGDNCE